MTSIEIVTAFTNKTFIIGDGETNKLPWHIPEDMRHFTELTKNGVVIMGRKTFESIPEKYWPLKSRLNIVVTNTHSHNHQYIKETNVVFITIEELDGFIMYFKKVFIIGGAMLYKYFMGKADIIHATIIDSLPLHTQNTFIHFPIESLHMYKIHDVSDTNVINNKSYYRFITYKKHDHPEHDEFKYIDTLDYIMKHGNSRPDRTGVGTISIFGHQMTFDISTTIPLMTTKFVGFNSILKELLWFWRGETDSKILEKDNVNIWMGNTSEEFLKSRNLPYERGDLGPMYGHALRAFGSEYETCNTDYTGKGFDQIANLIKNLKTDPYSRRHVLTTFNPAVMDQCVLMPCHGIVIQFYVLHMPFKLSCHVYNRSQDMILGWPYNAASYAILTHLIAKICGMVPDKLIISIGDAHIYNSHFEQANLQMSRNPLPYPMLKISDNVLKEDHIPCVEDFELLGYLYHPSIKAEMAI